MRVLVGCEFSGIVRDAFRAQGHEAWSCDLLLSEQPGPHIQGDVLSILGDGWDLAIFHPPCTYLCNSGARWWRGRQMEQRHALAFVELLLRAPIPRIALENPEGCISTRIRHPSQVIQPYFFGHDARKATALWLHQLPRLRPTCFVEASRMRCGACGTIFPACYGLYGCACLSGRLARPLYANQTPSGQNKIGQSATRASTRSRTYPGIAAAMALQWTTF